jgi:hypothetical protein
MDDQGRKAYRKRKMSDITLRVQGGWIDCCTIYSAVGLCGVHECRRKVNHVNGSAKRRVLI